LSEDYTRRWGRGGKTTLQGFWINLYMISMGDKSSNKTAKITDILSQKSLNTVENGGAWGNTGN
jgi:hypothetical protein